MSDGPSVAIVGAGFAGLGIAARLRQAGVRDVTILDRGTTVGGTWRDNTYPGAACDIPAHLYSFSFAPRSDWTTAYPRQGEIEDYLQELVDRLDIRSSLRLGADVTSARFDERTARWTLTERDGTVHTADVLVGAIGALRDPEYPDLPGRDTFTGPQFHTARWDHDVDLAGKRVGVVGTGSSAIQAIPPIAREAASVTVFQRSAPWVIPVLDRRYTRVERWLLRHVPGLRALYRWLIYWQKELRVLGFRRDSPAMGLMERYAAWNMRRHVHDPELRRALTPDYRMGCKRILLSNSYYPTLTRDHVDLVTDRLTEVTPQGIRTEAGHHGLDVIVWATGFRVHDPLGSLEVTGLDGRDLRQRWGERPTAYLGTSVPGFPNLFLLLGPNTGLGHNSMIFMLEAQIEHVLEAVDRIGAPSVAYLDVREEVHDRYVAEVDRRLQDTVWASGCHSWYLNEDGENSTLWPGWTVEFWRRARSLDPDAYRVVRREDVEVPAVA